MSNPDMKLIDGELFVSGKVLIRLTIGTAISRPKSAQAGLFQSGVMPLLKRKNAALWSEVTALITRLGEIQYRFKIRRGMQTVEGMNPFCLLDEPEQARIDDLSQRIDEEVGLAEIMRAMRFQPVSYHDGSPIAS